MSEKEQQFRRIYKETQDFGRTQFVREIQMQINDNKKKDKEIERLNNIINECAEDILKELEGNHHLSYGVALGIRQKLLDYKELKGSDSNE